MEPITNASLRLDTNIDAMNKAKDIQKNTVLPLLEQTMMQQEKVQQQQVSQSVANSLGMGINLDIKG